MCVVKLYKDKLSFVLGDSLYVTVKDIKMTKRKNIEYENGMKFLCGPPIRAGSYDNWNWCKQCTSIWKKGINRCGDCNQMIRAKPKGNKNYITKSARETARMSVIKDLSGR